MTDIVEKLREPVAYGPVGSQKEREEAADEIEASRKLQGLAWAAGLFEGEGSIGAYQTYSNKERNQDGSRRKRGMRFKLTLNSTDKDVIDRFEKIIGCGRRYGPYKDKRGDHYKPQFRWEISNPKEQVRSVLLTLLPFLCERRTTDAMTFFEAMDNYKGVNGKWRLISNKN